MTDAVVRLNDAESVTECTKTPIGLTAAEGLSVDGASSRVSGDSEASSNLRGGGYHRLEDWVEFFSRTRSGWRRGLEIDCITATSTRRRRKSFGPQATGRPPRSNPVLEDREGGNPQDDRPHYEEWPSTGKRGNAATDLAVTQPSRSAPSAEGVCVCFQALCTPHAKCGRCLCVASRFTTRPSATVRRPRGSASRCKTSCC